MKKRSFWIILLAILLVLALIGWGAVQIIRHTTQGEIYEADGLHQNSRVYMENIRIEDGRIHYTVVQKTCNQVHHWKRDALLEKKVDGQWKALYDESLFFEVDFAPIKPFHKRDGVVGLDRILSLDDPVGEYRIIQGKFSFYEHGTKGSLMDTVFDEDRTYIVGYFTITEDMLQ